MGEATCARTGNNGPACAETGRSERLQQNVQRDRQRIAQRPRR
jgi:hypothetical protein